MKIYLAMNQKGFSAIAGIIVGLVILSAVVVGGVLMWRDAKRAPVNEFELDKVQVGDSVAVMEVISIDVQSFGPQPIVKEEDFFMNLGFLAMEFSGKETISGEYLINALNDCPSFVPDLESQNKLPALKINYKDEFGNTYNYEEQGAIKINFLCLEDAAGKLDFASGGRATVVIDELRFQYPFVPSEPSHSAKLVEVL